MPRINDSFVYALNGEVCADCGHLAYTAPNACHCFRCHEQHNVQHSGLFMPSAMPDGGELRQAFLRMAPYARLQAALPVGWSYAVNGEEPAPAPNTIWSYVEGAPTPTPLQYDDINIGQSFTFLTSDYSQTPPSPYIPTQEEAMPTSNRPPERCGRCAAEVHRSNTDLGPINVNCTSNCTHQVMCQSCINASSIYCMRCSRHHTTARTPWCQGTGNMRVEMDGRRYGACLRHCGHARCSQCSVCITEQSQCYDCRQEGIYNACRSHCAHTTGDVPRRPDYVTNPVRFWSGKKSRDKKLSQRYIAAEIETAGSRTPKTVLEAVNKWSGSIVSDGSLPQYGYEINTAPASLDMYERQIEEVCAALKDAKTRVSDACGLHVHVDCRDFDFMDVRRLMALWYLVEPAMFCMVAESRRDSTYCREVGWKYARPILDDPSRVRVTVFGSIYGRVPNRETNILTMKQSKYQGSRYSALNMHSWAYRGTIENRMHQGTVDPVDIINWGRLNAALADKATLMRDADLREMVSKGIDDDGVRMLLADAVPSSMLPWLEKKLGEESGFHAEPIQLEAALQNESTREIDD